MLPLISDKDAADQRLASDTSFWYERILMKEIIIAFFAACSKNWFLNRLDRFLVHRWFKQNLCDESGKSQRGTSPTAKHTLFKALLVIFLALGCGGGGEEAFVEEELFDDAQVPMRPATALTNVVISDPIKKHTGDVIPLAVGPDGTLYGFVFSTLQMSTDDGASWPTQLHFFDEYSSNGLNAMIFTGDGEALVAQYRGAESNGLLWKSTGFAEDRAAATWELVLQSSSQDTFFLDWGMDVHGPLVLITEYGGKGQTGSRLVWLSKDYGETFEEVFDLADYEDLTDHHMHGCFIDPWTTSLWILNGDLPEGSAIRYSDDLGQTWHKLNDNMHITGIALRGGLLFSSDQAPDGAYSARRISAYELADTQLALAIDNGDYWYLNYVGGAWRRARDHQAAYAGWTVYNGTLPGVIIGSADGFTAHQIWQDTKTYGRHGGVVRVVGPTASAKLIAVLRDDNDPLFAYRILTADPPLWIEGP
jgi:hypothetical protein